MNFPPEHWKYNSIIPGSKESKYDFEYIATFNYELWMDKLGNNDFIKINIESHLIELCEKHIHYIQTGIINLTDLTLYKELKTLINNKKEQQEWFLRLSYRSAKDVPEGRLPVANADQILYAIIKSDRCFNDMVAHKYNALQGALLPPICIILTPYRKHNQERELRCFVYDNKLVAITNQQQWVFKGYELTLIYNINKFIDNLWKNNKLYYAAVVDIELDMELNPILIEFNPYGIKGSTSAVSFDWNESILYKSASITLRSSKNEEFVYKLN